MSVEGASLFIRSELCRFYPKRIEVSAFCLCILPKGEVNLRWLNNLKIRCIEQKRFCRYTLRSGNNAYHCPTQRETIQPVWQATSRLFHCLDSAGCGSYTVQEWLLSQIVSDCLSFVKRTVASLSEFGSVWFRQVLQGKPSGLVITQVHLLDFPDA